MPSPETPVKIAERLHHAAENILASGLRELLQSYGQVQPSGSYYLDLMAWPDIDIYLPLEETTSFYTRFLDLGPQLARIYPIVMLNFRDYQRYPSPELPPGLYWGVRLEEAGLRWKLDIWALAPEFIAAKQAELDRFRGMLTPEKRELILEIKQALITHEGRTPSFSGYNIYQAVLEKGLVELDEVKAYLRCQGVEV
jgi:hypothetical protein